MHVMQNLTVKAFTRTLGVPSTQTVDGTDLGK